MRSLPSAGPAVFVVLTACAAFATAAAAAPAGAAPSPDAPVPECRVAVHGSRSAATCHNPTPETVRLQLHVLCRRWWDPATDSRPVEAGPAQTAVLGGHCWKEIRAVWVTRR